MPDEVSKPIVFCPVTIAKCDQLVSHNVAVVLNLERYAQLAAQHGALSLSFSLSIVKPTEVSLVAGVVRTRMPLSRTFFFFFLLFFLFFFFSFLAYWTEPATQFGTAS